MSRFDCDYSYEEGIPWGLWERIVANALGGRRGQAALAAMEEALLALPEPKLIEGHLAADGQVCAIGALVAHRRAQEGAVDIATVIEAMGTGVLCWCGHGHGVHAGGGACSAMHIGFSGEARPCSCVVYEPEAEEVYETAEAGKAAGLSHSVAWHLAFLNDETLGGRTPEERYEKMLAWVRRAQGKEAVAA
jgi:hypothetical protein